MKAVYKYIAIIVFFLFNQLQAQNEAAIWFFGNKAGLDFNSSFPVSLNGSQMDTPEGCSSIADGGGNLLFYSDGITVWNQNHMVMLNGDNLFGDKSSTQSALIVPKPESDTIYYIFTVDDRAGVNGLRYSEVDMTMDSGLGAVTSNKNIPLASPTTEKITAVEHANGVDIWVISHLWNSDSFVSYLVSPAGVNTTAIISSTGSSHGGNFNNSIGYLKASPSGEKIASVKAYENNRVEIFDFDAATGTISNPITISNYTSEDLGPYGCEFSPNSDLLYVSEINRDDGFSRIHQYNVSLGTQAAIINSDVIISESNTGEYAALQQAIDGKIYVAEQYANELSVINQPNLIGADCDFNANTITLSNGASSKYGLPPFIQSFFFARNLFKYTCFGDITEFNIEASSTIDSILWDFGDPASGSNNTSTDLNPTHVFSNIGEFTITVTIQSGNDSQIIYRTLTISEEPDVIYPDPLITCEGEDVGIGEFNLEMAIPDYIVNDSSLAYTFYPSMTDAEMFINPILDFNTFTNTSNPQTIYIRLQNILSDCYSISECDLIVLSKPNIEIFDTAFFCSNSPSDYVEIDVGPLDDSFNNYNFLWLETQESTSSIQVYQPGDYTVRITHTSTITPENPEGCYAERIVSVSTSEAATIESIDQLGPDSIDVNVFGMGQYIFAIDNDQGPYQVQNYFSDVSPGIHIVYVKDENGCGISQMEFSILGFPKYITPNNDGFKDKWQVYGISERFQPKSKIFIFDRFGKLLKELDPLGSGWDGTFNGKALPNDDYWFAVTLQDGRIFKSHFTLKR